MFWLPILGSFVCECPIVVGTLTMGCILSNVMLSVGVCWITGYYGSYIGESWRWADSSEFGYSAALDSESNN